MSSVLHPVGPEPRERYWVRRLAVVLAAIVAIGVVIALVGNAMSAGSAVQAEPAPPTYVPPAAPSSATASASPTNGTGTPTPGPSTPASTPSASPTPTGSPTPSPEPSSSKSADTKTAEKKAASKKSAKKKVVKQPVYAACDSDDLRPTLTGDKTVKVKHKTTLALSLINGGKKTCKVAVTPKNVTLTVVSGGDRIWSTKDCAAAMPSEKRTLLPEHALSWKVTWSGKRSGQGCASKETAPKKGYYWAIASVDGSGDVRFRLILT